jgi:diguanylate cyclase (GGDEF)-like protein
MVTLTDKEARLLSEILAGAGEDAVRFRVSHDDAYDEIDDMERRRLLLKSGTKYVPSLLAIADLRAKGNTTADSVYYFCAHLTDVMRRLYRTAPEARIDVTPLAKEAEAAEGKVRRALTYLLETPLCSLALTTGEGIAGITPHEALTRLVPQREYAPGKTFEAAIALLNKQYEERNRPPASSASGRPKDQKFGILDSPGLLARDLAQPCGILGRAVLYVDIDNLKALNDKLKEVVVDRLIFPVLHELIARCVEGQGYAYKEGGDEIVILLRNTTEKMAVAFAEEVRERIAALQYKGGARLTPVTVSIGVAHGGSSHDGAEIHKRANEAKHDAKAGGRNRVALWSPSDHKGRLEE